jgi:hypothetical protein
VLIHQDKPALVVPEKRCRLVTAHRANVEIDPAVAVHIAPGSRVCAESLGINNRVDPLPGKHIAKAKRVFRRDGTGHHGHAD